eukprot:m.73237 g.73237  ORF g.73237 m.73237 type:complete len:77 (+) comp35831_c0_seq1:347-577(+)
MIELKDEYKTINSKLRKENDKLKTENSTLFSDKLEEKDQMIENLEKEVLLLNDKCKASEKNRAEIEAMAGAEKQSL